MYPSSIWLLLETEPEKYKMIFNICDFFMNYLYDINFNLTVDFVKFVYIIIIIIILV
jgi:hypothetical protein